MTNGYKISVKKKLVEPYPYHDGRLTVSAHYRGFVSFFDDGRKLWTRGTGIDRVSRGGAKKDAQILAHDIILQSQF